MKYVKKPVVIEAIQWDGSNFNIIKDFANVNVRYRSYYEHNKYYESKDTLVIKTLEGEMLASKGDYIIRGIKGEFYPCKPDIFEMTYEKI